MKKNAKGKDCVMMNGAAIILDTTYYLDLKIKLYTLLYNFPIGDLD